MLAAGARGGDGGWWWMAWQRERSTGGERSPSAKCHFWKIKWGRDGSRRGSTQGKKCSGLSEARAMLDFVDVPARQVYGFAFGVPITALESDARSHALV